MLRGPISASCKPATDERGALRNSLQLEEYASSHSYTLNLKPFPDLETLFGNIQRPQCDGG